VYKILTKEDLNPVTKLFKVYTPDVARKAQAGQFIIRSLTTQPFGARTTVSLNANIHSYTKAITEDFTSESRTCSGGPQQDLGEASTELCRSLSRAVEDSKSFTEQ
jgi:hypothetical protein